MKPRALLALLGVMALCLGVVVISSQARKTPSRIDPPAASSPRKSEAPPVDVATQAGKKEALDVVSGLVGHVVDEGDRPVEGVHALDASKCDEVLAASDAGGRMVLREEQLQLHPFERVAVVRLEHPGFAPELVRLPRGIRSFRAVLGRPTVLMVRVVDKDRLPIPQAILQVFESDQGSSQIAAWYRDRPVDARGEVRIDDVRPGALVLRALAPGFEDARHIVVARAGERRDVTISMSKAKTLHVRVRDTSGTPVVGVAVLASHSGGGMSGPLVGNVVTHWTHKTDGEGRTRFSSIPISVTGVTLAVKSDHYGPTTQEVEMAAGDKEVEVLLNAGAHLAVEVVSSDGTSIECSLKLRDLEGDPFG